MDEAPEEAGVPEGETSTQSWRGEEKSADGSEQAARNGNRTEVREASDQNPPTSGGPEPEETEQANPHRNMVELLSDHRANCEYMWL